MAGLAFHSIDRRIIWIILMAFVIRLISIPMTHRTQYTSDEREYISIGERVASGGDFIDSNGERSARSPLFPLILAALFRLVGASLLLPHVLNCAFGALIVLLGCELSLQYGADKTAALTTAAALSLYPGLVVYSGLLQTESMYIVFLLLVLIVANRVLESPTFTNTVVLGIIGGLAALTRVVFLGFFPCLLVALAWIRWNGAQRNLLPLVFVALVSVVVLLPWTIRNYRVHGKVVLVSSGGWRSLLAANNPYASGTWRVENGFGQWFRQKATEQGITNADSIGELDSDEISRKIAFEYIISNPLETLKLMTKKAHIFIVYPITHSDSYLPLQALAVAVDLMLLVGVAVGLVTTVGLRTLLMPLYLALVYFSSVHLLLHAEARFRLPLVPLLCMFFGFGVSNLMDKNQRAKFFASRNVRLALGGIVASIVLVYSYTGWLFLMGKV